MSSISRREYITLLGRTAIALPLAARAQEPERVRRLSVLINLAENDPEARPRLIALQQRLQELGWVENRNIRIDYRWTAGDYHRTQTYAADLVALAPDVIIANGAPVTEALQKATHTVPIVFLLVPDPVASGFIPSLAHPGGNITGFTGVEFTLGGKWLELLKEAAPSVTRVAIIHNPENRLLSGFLPPIEAVASSAGVQLIPSSARGEADIQHAIEAFAGQQNVGFVVLPDIIAAVHRELIVALATRHRLPAVYPYRYYATSGGLISYGIDTAEVYRQAASYVDRILKGARPGDLPIQQPTKFELVINLKAAKALGLTVPDKLIVAADEVIE